MWKLIAICVPLIYRLHAADFETCPARIDVRPQQIAKTAPGWTAGTSAEATHNLWFITMYDGPPKDHASLVPDTDQRLKQAWTRDSGRPYWLECHYTQTNIVLARPVPAGMKLCEVTHVPSVTRDGFPCHYSALSMPLDWIRLDPRSELSDGDKSSWLWSAR